MKKRLIVTFQEFAMACKLGYAEMRQMVAS